MKTLEEAREYLEGVEKWEDEQGMVANPDDRYFDLLDFKRTIDLAPYDLEVRHTNAFDKFTKTNGEIEEEFVWSVKLEGLGLAVIGLYIYTADTSIPSFWAELTLAGEPWWDDDPYFCTDDQINSLVSKLPAKHLAKFQKLASLNPVTYSHFTEAGVFEDSSPKMR